MTFHGYPPRSRRRRHGGKAEGRLYWKEPLHSLGVELERDVQQGLFHLARIGPDGADFRCELSLESNLLTDQPSQHHVHAPDHLVEVDHSRLQDLLSIEGEELPRDPCPTLRRRHNLVELRRNVRVATSTNVISSEPAAAIYPFVPPALNAIVCTPTSSGFAVFLIDLVISV